ncbi:phosphatase PAP2 family protein [uncultured Bartonella sp.]|uniref:acid phosphatase n=1 Tax=uncultured Bartonella sp. TaxID=104108 RepID=UPI00261346CD|nr:phosphatase PAP2 family protein [uncultured Bartonella sp.]
MRKTKKLTIAVIGCAALFCSGYYMSGSGYLNRYGEHLMLLTITPPPEGSAEQKRDEKVFLETRSYKDNARWKQAIIDSTATKKELIQGFSCATGYQLSAATMPNFFKLFAKTNNDAERLIRKSKKTYKISRPYIAYGGVSCTSPAGYDYPSGHAMEGWTAARLLVEYFPEHRAAIFAHARSFAESRVICGVHSVSAVEVDEDYSESLIDRLKKLPTFQKDLESAKDEMAKLKKLPQTDGHCEKFPAEYVKPFSINTSLSL